MSRFLALFLTLGFTVVSHGATLQQEATTPTAADAAKRPSLSGHGNEPAAFVKAHDNNGDGVLTAQEFEVFRRARFDATDRNHDGAIGLEEYATEFEQRCDAVLAPRRTEMNRMLGQRFDALADASAHITRQAFDAETARLWRDYPGMPARSEGSGGALSLPTTHSRAGMLELYDRNLDGTLSLAELRQSRDEEFERTDSNRDRRLNLDEYANEFAQRLKARESEIKAREARQTGVRFGVLDTNKDDRIDWNVYMASGRRLFTGNDRNHDGRVDAADTALPAPAHNGT